MHKYRRQAKFAAWYDDPEDEDNSIPIKNPFRKYRAPSTRSKLQEEIPPENGAPGRASTFPVVHSKATPDEYSINQRRWSEAVEGKNDVEVIDRVPTSESARPIDSSSDSRVEAQNSQKFEPFQDFSYSGTRKRVSLLDGLQFWHNEKSKPATADALRNADSACRTRLSYHSKIVVASLELGGKAAVKKIRTINEFEARSSVYQDGMRPGLRIIYVLDNDSFAQQFIEHIRSGTTADRGWQKFKDWMTRSRTGRSTTRRITQWSSARNGGTTGGHFAFGLESCDLYSTSEEKKNGFVFLDVVNQAKKLGVYEQTEFAKLVTAPRRAVYYHQRKIERESKATAEETEAREEGSSSGPAQSFLQRTIVVAHSRPYHLRSEDIFKRKWEDHSVWSELFQSYEDLKGPVDDDFDSFRLTRSLLSAVMDESVESWTNHVGDLEKKFTVLESHVYDHPSDDSPSADLWSLSKHLLEVQQMIGQHANTMQWLQHLLNMAAAEQSENHESGSRAYDRWIAESTPLWLEEQIAELKDLAQSVEDDLMKPIDHMIDLMYKSVSIRDARISLDLNASLWRLSWITFIFLPLTFLVGFFGMNVDTFNSHPSLRWYFVAAVPFMSLILLTWFGFKRFLSDTLGMHSPEKKDS